MKLISKKPLMIYLICALLISVFFLNVASASLVQPSHQRTYTIDADFNEGTLVGVEHDTIHDQLQLSKTNTTLPFIWVPSQDGTVSKLNTINGQELGRYRIAPTNLPVGGNPSRTTVDLDGNCWVGNRQAGTVVKIGLLEAGQWIDRNGDGVCQTSLDLNNDGYINGTEILPWGQDECVLYEVVLIPGHIGVYTPGTYPGPYDTDYWGVAPRGLAIDAQGNLWAGTSSTQTYFCINGSTGAIIRTIDVSPWQHSSYGAVIDKNGIIWSTSYQGQHVLRIDPVTNQISRINIPTYGIGLDYNNHVFVTSLGTALTRINITTGTVDWTKNIAGLNGCRGVVCSSDNKVWVANSNGNTVTVYDNDGNYLQAIPVGSTPSGVSIDSLGKVWTCDIGDINVHRINPATFSVDLTKGIIGSSGHYTYSDMTGIISRTITTKIGTWTVTNDSGIDGATWGTLSWNSSEPAGTSITVKVRSSNNQVNWSAWESATNGTPLVGTPNGRYLQIEVTFQINSGDTSPILYDLTVIGANEAPALNYIGARIGTVGQVLQFRISAMDPNGDPLTYSVGNLPTGATFDPVRKIFKWTPAQVGVYSGIHFEVTDGKLSDSEDITITVNP